MIYPKDRSVVLDIAGNKGVILPKDDDVHKLVNVGFTENSDGLYEIQFHSEIQKIDLINFLLLNGFLFSSGRDWSPEEDMRYIKDQGKINSGFYYIYWSSPNRYEINFCA